MTHRNERRILQISAVPFPQAIRVVKEAVSLAAAGYQSAVLHPPLSGKPERETWRGVEIFRPALLDLAGTTADKLIYQTTYYSPAWFRAIRGVIREYRPDVLHVHDIWLGRTALLAMDGQKLVMDLHENMPAAVVEYLKGYRGLFKWFNAIFKNKGRVTKYERGLLQRSDRVFVVVEEALQRVLGTHPLLARDKVINVENLESKNFLADEGGTDTFIERDHFSILYIGGFGPHRGIDTLIEAMKHIKAWGLNVRVHLVGAREGSNYVRMIKDLIRDLEVGSHVSVTGWVPFKSVLGYIRQASVGAVPHHSNPHTDNTIPHKLYQYMIASRPVLVSTSPPLARTVRSAQAGVIFEADDSLDCAEKIREMFSNPQRLEEYGANGYDYVIRQGHNWEDESAPILVAAYDNLLGCGP